MPPWSEDDKGLEQEADGLDRISALPDEVIHHLLGLLPAPEAVRTSVLAKGWRHHWKSMRNLQFAAVSGGGPVFSADWLNRFMGRLLRDLCAPLDACDITVQQGRCDKVTALDADHWVRQAVSKHHAREVMVDFERSNWYDDEPSFGLAGQPLVSQRLVKLELHVVSLGGRILDFSRCIALEDLVMFGCNFKAKNISSQSLKHLRIEKCTNYRRKGPLTISAPNLVSLKLQRLWGADLVLQIMPLLETATVNLKCYHYCEVIGRMLIDKCCWDCESCSDAHSGGCCMLLHALSKATHLELIVPFAKFTDLKCYPTFSKLKTLLLYEWCLVADLPALVCILQTALVLENLTIDLKEQKKTNESEGNYHPEQLSAISEHLKLVKIKGIKNDVRISKLSKFFSELGIQISIVTI